MSPDKHLFNIVVAALATNSVALVLRLWIRVAIQRSFGFDDAALCFSFVGYVLFASFTFVALHYGYGVSPAQPWFNSQEAQHYWFACLFAYIITAGIIKISIALVLLRINVRRSIKVILIVLMVLATIIVLVLSLLLGLQCRPLSLSWGVGEGKCFDWRTIVHTSYAFSICDIIFQWLLSLLPIPMLWNVQISPREKISISVLLGLGMISSIATLVRFKYLLDVPNRHESDPASEDVRNALLAVMWSHIELFLAMLATSLVACRPALRRAIDMVSEGLLKPYIRGFNRLEDYTELSNIRRQEPQVKTSYVGPT
ncbi:hypothetical protein F5X96DRAFT_638920 [Biscogniauxia mediterranea]|nr:hypothetical protein F5X96DRAFT_638920 [Biscogniauxia mediterranea]